MSFPLPWGDDPTSAGKAEGASSPRGALYSCRLMPSRELPLPKRSEELPLFLAVGSEHGAISTQAHRPALGPQDLGPSGGTAGKDFHTESLAGKK